jgi:hypothetical protein
MRLGYLLWLIAVIIAVLVGLSKYAGINVPQVTDFLMKDPAQSLFIALALAVVSKFV